MLGGWAGHGLWSRTAQVHGPPCPPSSCGTLGKFLSSLCISFSTCGRDPCSGQGVTLGFQAEHVLDKHAPSLLGEMNDLSWGTSDGKYEKPISEFPRTGIKQEAVLSQPCRPVTGNKLTRGADFVSVCCVSRSSPGWDRVWKQRKSFKSNMTGPCGQELCILEIWATDREHEWIHTDRRRWNALSPADGEGTSCRPLFVRSDPLSTLSWMSPLFHREMEECFSFSLEDLLNTWPIFRLKFSPLFVFRYCLSS